MVVGSMGTLSCTADKGKLDTWQLLMATQLSQK